MVEEKKEEPPKTEATKNEETLAKIEAATVRMDKANAEYKKNKAEAEAEKADAMLDGDGEAGGVAEKKEISPEEYTKKVMAGEVPP